MHIGSDDTLLCLEPRNPAQHQILPDPRDQIGQLSFDGFAVAGERRRFQRVDIAVGADCECADRAGKLARCIVALGVGVHPAHG